MSKAKPRTQTNRVNKPQISLPEGENMEQFYTNSVQLGMEYGKITDRISKLREELAPLESREAQLREAIQQRGQSVSPQGGQPGPAPPMPRSQAPPEANGKAQ